MAPVPSGPSAEGTSGAMVLCCALLASSAGLPLSSLFLRTFAPAAADAAAFSAT